MFRVIIVALISVLLVGCASMTHQGKVMNSIRTDGVYVQKDENPDGSKLYLKFYKYQKDGEEKMNVKVAGSVSGMPNFENNKVYDTWFIIPSSDTAIQYRVQQGNMGYSVKHRFIDYQFIPQ